MSTFFSSGVVPQGNNAGLERPNLMGQLMVPGGGLGAQPQNSSAGGLAPSGLSTGTLTGGGLAQPNLTVPGDSSGQQYNYAQHYAATSQSTMGTAPREYLHYNYAGQGQSYGSPDEETSGEALHPNVQSALAKVHLGGTLNMKGGYHGAANMPLFSMGASVGASTPSNNASQEIAGQTTQNNNNTSMQRPKTVIAIDPEEDLGRVIGRETTKGLEIASQSKAELERAKRVAERLSVWFKQNEAALGGEAGKQSPAEYLLTALEVFEGRIEEMSKSFHAVQGIAENDETALAPATNAYQHVMN